MASDKYLKDCDCYELTKNHGSVYFDLLNAKLSSFDFQIAMSVLQKHTTAIRTEPVSTLTVLLSASAKLASLAMVSLAEVCTTECMGVAHNCLVVVDDCIPCCQKLM